MYHLVDCMLCLSLGCKKPKYHRPGGLNNRHSVLTIWRLRSPRSRCWLIQFLVRALSGLEKATFSLCSYVGGGERKKAGKLGSPLTRALILSWRPHPMTLSEPLYLPNPPPPNTITFLPWWNIGFDLLFGLEQEWSLRGFYLVFLIIWSSAILILKSYAWSSALSVLWL